jgi:hypothetical protein
MYYLQIRNSKHGWHRLSPANYTSLVEAADAIESFIHTNPLRHGKLLTKGVFRTVRVKAKPVEVAACIK